MKRAALILMLLLAASASCAEPKIELPAEVRGQVGGFIRVDAKTEGKVVFWVALDTGLNVFPGDLLKVSTTTVVTAERPGRFRLLAYTALGDQPSPPAYTVVVVEGPVPPPVPPGPGPMPPPDPTDPLAVNVQSAYALEASAAKAEHKAALASLYRQAADVASARQELRTWGDLWNVMAEAARTLGVGGTLPQTQSVIARHMSAEFPRRSSDPLDATGRTQAAGSFRRIAAALEAAR